MQCTKLPSLNFPNAIPPYLAAESLEELYLNSMTLYAHSCDHLIPSIFFLISLSIPSYASCRWSRNAWISVMAIPFDSITYNLSKGQERNTSAYSFNAVDLAETVLEIFVYLYCTSIDNYICTVITVLLL